MRETVTLRQITEGTVRAVCDLRVSAEQEHYVASNAVSLAQALFSPAAWYQAVYADEVLVGFVMLRHEAMPPTAAPSVVQRVSVWRLMVDARFQGRGFGRRALELVLEEVQRQDLYRSLELSYAPGIGSPEGFYRKLGFSATGEMRRGEIVMSQALEPSALDVAPVAMAADERNRTKQVIVVCRELRVPAGKLAAQVAHAAVGAFLRTSPEDQAKWLSDGMPKVVLAIRNGADLIELERKARAEGLPFSLVQDAGRTVVPAGTTTCLGIGPASAETLSRVTGTLKLL